MKIFLSILAVLLLGGGGCELLPSPDESLSELNKDFLVGNWTTEQCEFELITLYEDGGYYTFGEHNLPHDAGEWEFDNKTLTLNSSTDPKFDKTYTKLSIGAGDDWIILYEGEKTLTWKMEIL